MIALLWILVAVNCISFTIFVFSAAAAIRRARRDYFAAKAMQGELAAQSEQSGFYPDANLHALAARSYKAAYAMEVARKTGRPA